MPGERVRVSRALYASALADAIDWQESLLDAQNHDATLPGGRRCCTPGARCEEYLETAALLARYRHARSALTGGHAGRDPDAAGNPEEGPDGEDG